MFQKSLRKIDKKLLKKISMSPCVACGRVPTEKEPNDPDHIATRGAGNDDTEDNVWPLCRKHHIEKGMGLKKFINKYPSCKQWLEKNNRTDVFERLERK